MRILYLASEYPGISHTFIFREVGMVRAEGIPVVTASIRRPAHLSAMTEEEQREARDTLYVKDGLLRRGLADQGWLLRHRPGTWAAMARGAMLWCGWAGPKSPLRAAGYFLEACVLLRHALGHGVEHIHVHFANPASTVAMLAAAGGDLSFSISAHGPDIFYDVPGNLLALKAQRATFIRCISHYCASQFQRITPYGMWDKFAVVRCGVDTNVFSPLPRALPENGPVRFLCLGRLCPAKGQHLLLEAFARLRGKGLSARLTLVGGGEDTVSLREHASRLGLSEDVVFTGPVGQGAARAAYDEADVFVLPSMAEGLPVVLMEAMAKELPCVSTRITGIPELIDHGANGLLVTPGDLDGLAVAMETVASDAELRMRLGRAGREKIISNHSLQASGGAMAALFRERLGFPRGSGI